MKRHNLEEVDKIMDVVVFNETSDAEGETFHSLFPLNDSNQDAIIGKIQKLLNDEEDDYGDDRYGIYIQENIHIPSLLAFNVNDYSPSFTAFEILDTKELLKNLEEKGVEATLYNQGIAKFRGKGLY